jgi:hypothetical protein
MRSGSRWDDLSVGHQRLHQLPEKAGAIQDCGKARLTATGRRCPLFGGEGGIGVWGAAQPGPDPEPGGGAGLCHPFVCFPFDDPAADQYGTIRAALASAGTPIGPNDLLIAAIALANGLTLVTLNTTEFSRIPGLTIEDWEA